MLPIQKNSDCYSDHAIKNSTAACTPRVAGRLSTLPRAADALARPAVTLTRPRACPTGSSAQISFSFAFTRSQQQRTTALHCRRRQPCHHCSPWHHRQQALTHSSAVYSSASSTSPWSRKVKVEAVLLLLRGRAPCPARAPSSSRALATASRLTPSRPQIPHHLLYLVHPLVEPIERS